MQEDVTLHDTSHRSHRWRLRACLCDEPHNKNVKPHFCGRRGLRDWSRIGVVGGGAGTVGSSLYCGGDSGEG